MNTPFRLDDHKRRPQPLAPPPADYFERLPRQVMARVQPPAGSGSAAFGWLAFLPMPLRTALASVAVLGGFAASFFLSQPTAPASVPIAALEAVPHTEMVQYLLASDSRLTLTDLAELSAADHTLTDSFLQASPGELQDALDAQPTEENYL
ncbi:hypothetical protein LGH70_06395 [Hymenobacter sp. BT635]|uniref:Magnesium transporter MgtE intracellular domain-containing protein n=1 Tax=Hymenobacter nitidus TaxID=2880929 RepID=A0ABS8AAG4_9BACT|nr:hypothetical protein [Hymenobacter nitidus]MCB2377204.1 hypothetical protein [Hymenobacter nitidus]